MQPTCQLLKKLKTLIKIICYKMLVKNM